jgi:hypothetical protein
LLGGTAKYPPICAGISLSSINELTVQIRSFWSAAMFGRDALGMGGRVGAACP